ncbi:MAG: MerR family transcriptional regulator [Candidatus Eisenbacteria bacterium]
MAIRKSVPETDSKLYRSISEVSEMLDVKPHVLRYWETQFSMLRPKKNRAGNRMYRPDEVKLLLRIKELLYGRRYTIEGAKRTLLAERREESPQVELGFDSAERKLLLFEVKEGLRDIVAKLRRQARAPEAAPSLEAGTEH